MTQVDDMYIDGSIYLLDKGVVERFDSGQATVKNWTADSPGDTIMRPAAPFYTRIAADTAIKDQGNVYAYDGTGRRVVVFDKGNGSYIREYVLPTGSPFFSALKGMFISTGANGSNPMLYWIESSNLMRVPLTSPSAGPSASPSPTTKPIATPTKKPS
jgi:outer membrane protein assembly factor BamB